MKHVSSVGKRFQRPVSGNIDLAQDCPGSLEFGSPLPIAEARNGVDPPADPGRLVCSRQKPDDIGSNLPSGAKNYEIAFKRRCVCYKRFGRCGELVLQFGERAQDTCPPCWRTKKV